MLRLGSNLWLLNESKPTASVLQMSGGGIDTSFGSSLWSQFDSLDHIRWGIGDNQPNLMRKLIHRNSIVRTIMNQRIWLTSMLKTLYPRSSNTCSMTVLNTGITWILIRSESSR